jgi:integrase
MAKRRGNNEGSIYRRKDGYWVGQYGIQTPKGIKTRYIYGKRREDVREKLAKAIADRDGGLVYDAGNMTVGEYLDRWLNDSVRDTVRRRTWERYEQFVRVHLTPALGKIKVAKLTPAHVRGLYRDRLDSGLAPRTVLHIHRAFSKALKQAVADGLIPRNPAAPVKPPQPRQEEIRPLNREQVRALFEAASGNRLEALYVVAVTAGLRRGELQGLKWDDLDLEAGMLQVRRTLSEPKGGYIFEAPKCPARAGASGSRARLRWLSESTVSANLRSGCKRLGSGKSRDLCSPPASALPCPAATSTALSRLRSSAPGSRRAPASTTCVILAPRSC